MTRRPESGGRNTVTFLTEHGPYALLGAALGGFVGLALGGPGAPKQSVNGAVPATEWSDYLAHSWLPMVIGALVGAVLFAAVAKALRDRRRNG